MPWSWRTSIPLSLLKELPEASATLVTVEERDDRGGECRYGVDVIVGHARQDRKAVLGHPGAVPAGVALATAEQAEELDSMGRRQPVRITDHQHDWHRQAGDLCRPVVVDLHDLGDLSHEDRPILHPWRDPPVRLVHRTLHQEVGGLRA